MTTKLLGHHCDQCEKVFPSAAGLRMHKIRKHSDRSWSTGGNFAGRPRTKTPEQIKERKRAYQMKLRERYYSEGRNSHGVKMPPGWKPRPRIRRYPSDSPEYRRRYHRNHYMKKKQERLQVEIAPAPVQSDPLGDAAKAVLLAAKVLRGTLTALKLP